MLVGLVDDTKRSRVQFSDKGDGSLLASSNHVVFSKRLDYFLLAHKPIDKLCEVLYMWRSRRRQMD